ncbi:hypothetical protein [Lysinibacillus pakistanensis]|uniref:DUF4083 domain-containing protein n=1 Tax=Lysinibacillus pakistanensis TaxID=759811 RepID=A0AAX3WTU3_9BACI|nr:hypothetical protein [Lysinibacillus pakistanensis]MDM5230033.1 hypothetical protein [Lysinibacillus pakistanensis]WHY45631.1 hypothetical protein QNH22_20505 [Lysinibacillus pakistanensis]WHY50639.1 hypothetical protein QNH24_20470 [Lysinibacillus pakistanensis]
MFMLIIVIICFVAIFGGLGLLKFLRVQKVRKERKVVLEKRLEHLIQANKYKTLQDKNESSQ